MTPHRCPARYVARVALLAALTGVVAGDARAQVGDDALGVLLRIPERSPNVTMVAVRRDTVLFVEPYASDSTRAYAFLRLERRFVRVRRPADLAVRAAPYYGREYSGPDYPLVDSLQLVSITLPDDIDSHVIRSLDGRRTIPLRGPRIAAQRAWLRTHPIPPRRPDPDDESPDREPPPRTTWAGLRVLDVAIDSAAIWLGLAYDRTDAEYGLGGLMRVDRRTRAVETIADAALMTSSVERIVPSGGALWLLVAGRAGETVEKRVLRFDPRSRRGTPVPLPDSLPPADIAVARDTIWVAAGDAIAAVDLHTGHTLTRYFDVAFPGDTMVFELAEERPRRDDWDRIAALAVIEELKVRSRTAFLRAAAGAVRASGLRYYFPGDRVYVTAELHADSAAQADTGAAEPDPYEGRLTGPYEVYVAGLDHPAVRPFLAEMLRSAWWWPQLVAARTIRQVGDRSFVPVLREALGAMEYPHNAEVAVTLGLLGDSTGFRWVRAALYDTLRSSASADSSQRVHHFVFDAAAELQDEGSVPRLLELLRDRRYESTAIAALVRYRSPTVWRRLPGAVGDLGWPIDAVLRRVAEDSLPVFDDPDMRDSIRALARRAMLGRDMRLKASAARVIVRYANVDDVPALIGALTQDPGSYEEAVLALVRLAGAGDEAMPRGKGTPAERARAQQWWMAWYAAHRTTFRPAPKAEADAAWTRMLQRLRSE